jgi:hypothetical protein
MTKIAAKTRSAKVYDDAYGDVANKQGEQIKLDLFDSLLQDISMSALQGQMQKFRSGFVSGIEEALGQDAKDIIMPPGTRLWRRSRRAVCFAVEMPPAVRTLNFTRSEVNDSNITQWSLALPYVYFFMVFVAHEDNRHELSSVAVGCRTEPLSSPDDMLYCLNLPNMYSVYVVPDKIPSQGVVPDLQNMSVCQGYRTHHRNSSNAFKPKPDSFCDMSQEVIQHFWASRFTAEKALVYNYMKRTNPEFKNLETWQRHSLQDPLFVLGVEYVPAIRLNALFDNAMNLHDKGFNNHQIANNSSRFVDGIYDGVWREVQKDENYQKVRVDLSQAVLAKFNEAMQRFSKELSKNMSSMSSNEVVKRHVLLAITSALRVALR